MKALDLYNIRKRYFGYEDIARIRGIRPASAKVAASRYVKQGLLVRLKSNLYMLRHKWESTSLEEKFRLANLIQSPSYISLTTALAYYERSTQVQQNFFESIAIRRTKEIQLDGTVFRYSKINDDLYFGFRKEKEFFIASPEKALLDAVYLMSCGRYALDLPALEIGRFDRNTICELANRFPEKTRSLLKRHGYFQTTRAI